MKPCDRWCHLASCTACIWAGGTEPQQPDPDPDDTEGE